MSLMDYYWICVVLISIVQNTLQLPRVQNLFKEIDSCECGRTRDGIATRIVGGEVVESNIYPWMVAIFFNGRMHCGGTVINDRYILTAGHCLNKLNKDDLQVVLGVTDLQKFPEKRKGSSSSSSGGSGGTTGEVEIETTMVHEEFSSDYLHDMEDIGLIKLKNPVVFSDKINPICMPKSDANFESKKAVVTGWGRTDQDGNPSRALRKADLRVMKNDDCKNITSVGEHITDTMLCAYEYETDACQGDSGGPLVIENNGRMEQIGIVSWGIGCAKPGIPGVYSRMTSYVDWVASHTKDAVYCKNN